MDLLKSYYEESQSETDNEDVGEGSDEEISKDISTKSRIVSNSAGQSAGADFFGLNDDSDEETEEPPAKKKMQCLIRLKDSDSELEVPDSDFWRSFTPQNNLDHHEVLEEKNEQVTQQGRKQGGHRNKRHTDPNHSCSSKTDSWHSKDTRGSERDFNRKLSRESFNSSYQSQQNISSSRESQAQRQLFYVHSKIAPHMTKCNVHNRHPCRVERELGDHTQTVNRVMWNKSPYCHLFLSAAMDGTVRIWNIWTQLSPCVKLLRIHSRAVKDAVWSHDGTHVLSCSYDKTAKWIDVEKGLALSTFKHSSYVTSCKVHPNDPHLSITGSWNSIHCWDTRVSISPCKTYTHKDSYGQVQDLLFNRDGDTFFSAGDEISQDSADRNIMAWDFKSTSVLSNQIYQERYSCTRLKLHPTSSHFLAQSHGNYIAIFSANRPYKMNKANRLEGHKLSGYSVGFDISPDGSLVLSGDSTGQMLCYNYQTGKIINKIQTGLDVVMDVNFNPLLPSTAVVCGWNGKIQVLN